MHSQVKEYIFCTPRLRSTFLHSQVKEYISLPVHYLIHLIKLIMNSHVAGILLLQTFLKGEDLLQYVQFGLYSDPVVCISVCLE